MCCRSIVANPGEALSKAYVTLERTMNLACFTPPGAKTVWVDNRQETTVDLLAAVRSVFK
jgi:hypothetical protein